MTDDPACSELRQEFDEYRQTMDDYLKAQEASRKKQDDIFKAQNAYICDTYVKPLVKNVVGESLLFVIGEQPKKTAASTWYSCNKNSKKQNIRKRINAIVSLFGTIQDFKKVANHLITKSKHSLFFHCRIENSN